MLRTGWCGSRGCVAYLKEAGYLVFLGINLDDLTGWNEEICHLIMWTIESLSLKRFHGNLSKIAFRVGGICWSWVLWLSDPYCKSGATEGNLFSHVHPITSWLVCVWRLPFRCIILSVFLVCSEDSWAHLLRSFLLSSVAYPFLYLVWCLLLCLLPLAFFSSQDPESFETEAVTRMESHWLHSTPSLILFVWTMYS